MSCPAGKRDDRELLQIVLAQPAGSPLHEEACEALVRKYQGLVRRCVRKYRDSPEPAEDLMQVGYVGLMKAIKSFDASFGWNLASYAQPCIVGEIKRHFRDKRWQLHVRRSVQELRLEARDSAGELAQRLGRTPSDAELADYLGVSVTELADAQRAGRAMQASSLSAPLGDGVEAGTLEDVLGDEDPRLEATLDMAAFWQHLAELPGREQDMVLMRFYGNMTQSEIGEQVGLSQMHVSRLLAHALGYLRRHMGATGGEFS
jgi:RNA polymerase sigma-B factor